MKFNKKIGITSILLLTGGVIASGILTSCSQGATPNVVNNYAYKIGSNNYKISNNSIQYEESAGTFKSINDLYDAKKYDINKYVPSNPETFPNPDNLKKYNEAVLGNLVSSYIINICNQYLYLLTADPKLAVSNAHVNNQFELAYHIGMGEAKQTYRLRVNSLSFDMTDPLPPEWNYGQEFKPEPDNSDTSIPEDKRPQKINIKDRLIQVTNIKMTFGYWKSNGGSSVEDITNFNDIKNSNWQSYWREYLKTPEFKDITQDNLVSSWDVAFNKTLNLNVQPTISSYYKKVTAPTPPAPGSRANEGELTYYSTGILNVVGLDPKNTNDPFAWPLWFDGLQYMKEDKTTQVVNDVKTQVEFNNSVKTYVTDLYDGNFPYKNFLDANNPASTIFNSLKDSFTFTPNASASASLNKSVNDIQQISSDNLFSVKRRKTFTKA